jgi:hypothetical protein
MHWQQIPVLQAVAWYDDAAAAAAAAGGAAGVFEIATGAPALAYVEPMTRRRLSPLARAVLDCAGRCQTSAGHLRVVAASRHGELARTLSQLEDIAAGAEVSPTAFSLSVHNATAGLLSIVRRNRAPMSAVAAGEETFAWGLLDAHAAFAASPDEPVLYLYGDDVLPGALAEFAETADGLLAIGVLIAPGATRCLDIRAHPAACEADARSLPASFMSAAAEGCWTGRRLSWEWRWQSHSQSRVESIRGNEPSARDVH